MLPGPVRRGGRAATVPATDFDTAACTKGAAATCEKTRYGPWVQLDAALLAVTALSMSAPRVGGLTLIGAKSEDKQRELCRARDESKDEETPLCSVLRVLGGASASRMRVQARADLDLGSRGPGVRGADVGWVVWVRRARGVVG